MGADTRSTIEQALRRGRRIVPEHKLDHAFAQQTKTAIRRAAAEKGIDLTHERVSLWRERGDREFEHVGSTRTIYLAFQAADDYPDEIFIFNAIGGEALTFLTLPSRGGHVSIVGSAYTS